VLQVVRGVDIVRVVLEDLAKLALGGVHIRSHLVDVDEAPANGRAIGRELEHLLVHRTHGVDPVQLEMQDVREPHVRVGIPGAAENRVLRVAQQPRASATAAKRIVMPPPREGFIK
jgi:hypothetical protein